MAPSQLQARNPTLFQSRNETEDLFYHIVTYIQVKRIIEKDVGRRLGSIHRLLIGWMQI